MPPYTRATTGMRKGQFIKNLVRDKVEMLVKRNKERHKKIEIVKSYDGRSVVELQKLGEQLWCKQCDQPVSLRFKVHESVMGLAFYIRIKCHRCLNDIEVYTSSKSCNEYYDVNKKLAIGMYDSGMGESSVNTFLSALNIPIVNDKSLKRYERAVGSTIEKLAEESCIAALDLEKSLTIAQSNKQKYVINE